MPTAAQKLAKMCSVCGLDCSKMERFKDAMTGMYTCADCHNKQARVAPVAAAQAESGPIPLVDEAPAAWLDGFQALDVHKCKKCQALMSPGQEACLSCGFDPRPVVRDVKVIRKVAKKPKHIREEEDSRRIKGEPGGWGGIIGGVFILVLVVGVLFSTTGRNVGAGGAGIGITLLLVRVGLRIWLYSSRDD